jgi:hypothetical protein
MRLAQEKANHHFSILALACKVETVFARRAFIPCKPSLCAI